MCAQEFVSLLERQGTQNVQSSLGILSRQINIKFHDVCHKKQDGMREITQFALEIAEKNNEEGRSNKSSLMKFEWPAANSNYPDYFIIATKVQFKEKSNCGRTVSRQNSLKNPFLNGKEGNKNCRKMKF